MSFHSHHPTPQPVLPAPAIFLTYHFHRLLTCSNTFTGSLWPVDSSPLCLPCVLSPILSQTNQTSKYSSPSPIPGPVSAEAEAREALESSAQVKTKRLKFTFTFSPPRHKEETSTTLLSSLHTQSQPHAFAYDHTPELKCIPGQVLLSNQQFRTNSNPTVTSLIPAPQFSKTDHNPKAF